MATKEFEETKGNNQNGQIISDEEEQQVEEHPVGFWDPRLKPIRNDVIKSWAITSQY